MITFTHNSQVFHCYENNDIEQVFKMHCTYACQAFKESTFGNPFFQLNVILKSLVLIKVRVSLFLFCILPAARGRLANPT